MSILFSVVARGQTVLAKYASCAGNFVEVVDQVLCKITPENTKLTYSHGNYLFHYLTEDRITFLCITDDDFERARAFHYLSEIKRKFQMQYGSRGLTALPYSMNSEFSRVLANLMKYYSANRASEEKVEKVQGQVDDLKGVMVKNIDAIANRGEKLELLIDKTEDLSVNAVSFRKNSRSLAKKMWWKNVKIIVIIVIVSIVLLYFIVSAACGGLDWPCTRKKN